ncbi:MAG: BlaI/MecI/CopY family transcriptional regulator [Thermoplasmatales archaeon]|nr:BlaI/MecI/CopY family transcriptional regulator [Thermoplasmatales archaeon]
MKKIKEKLKRLLKYWGFEDIESEIFATLMTSDGLTAEEIANSIGYAYSTTVNSLNSLARMGYIERVRKQRKFVYSAKIDFVKIIEQEMRKISSMLKEIANDFKGKISYRKKFSKLAQKIEEALKYIEKMGA